MALSLSPNQVAGRVMSMHTSNTVAQLMDNIFNIKYEEINGKHNKIEITENFLVPRTEKIFKTNWKKALIHLRLNPL